MPQSSPNAYEYQTKSPCRSGAINAIINAIHKSATEILIFQLGPNSGSPKC